MSGSVIKNAMVDLRRIAARNEKRRRVLAAIAGACSVASTILTLLSNHVSRAQRSTSRAFTPVFAGYGDALQTRDLHDSGGPGSAAHRCTSFRAAPRPGHVASIISGSGHPHPAK